ncbi:PREDICTED: enoyl-CoA delta isomerase 3, peroxisomal-like [Nanorana parkeri]|uniref:enoyl-CoA delta isomerase 3, peroxisomal-like n=1 Tax=Nanorana parkeri TaxID=125878 RepID=UPI0008543B2A|nr:PREDICTED: enoyl-CoA delta isomerase 3, peroxisomal-like [Nanorana parkeri]
MWNTTEQSSRRASQVINRRAEQYQVTSGNGVSNVQATRCKAAGRRVVEEQAWVTGTHVFALCIEAKGYDSGKRAKCGNEPKTHIDVQLLPKLLSSETIKNARNSQSKYENIQVFYKDNITKIVIKRPEKKNALSMETYKEIANALEESGKDDSVFTVLTGYGDYFSSGNDLNNVLRRVTGNLDDMVKESISTVRNFVCNFIDFPKPLVAMVNGPAIGIGTTILGLCDLVYASDRATFNTPFSKLGQHPEACSSYTFPRIMGSSKATEVLLFNKTLTAREACNLGLVTEVFPDSTFQQEVWARLKSYATNPKTCLALSKQLVRNVDKERLHAVCEEEMELLSKRANSEDALIAIQQFFSRKSKM